MQDENFTCSSNLVINLFNETSEYFILYDWYRSTYIIRGKSQLVELNCLCEDVKEVAEFINCDKHKPVTVSRLICNKLPYDVNDVSYDNLDNKIKSMNQL